jgi:hypothetical protein
MPFVEGSEAPGLNYNNGSPNFRLTLILRRHLPVIVLLVRSFYSGLFNPCRSALRADVLLQLCNLLGFLLDNRDCY